LAVNYHIDEDPGGTFRPGIGRFRVIPVILWKQHSGRKFSGVFPIISGRFLPEYCFHAPAISCVFVQDPVAGIFVLGMNTLNEEQKRISFFHLKFIVVIVS
jgi:hypothetical protein